MRNWNQGVPTGSEAAYPWFLAYLWGIETYSLSIHAGLAIVFLAYLWGIETNKTGMYSWIQHKFLAYLWGIETGIERCPGQARGSVFSVPMRNWNEYKEIFLDSFPYGFLAYLWGIETYVLGLAMPISSVVFSVPMRNWNKLLHFSCTQPVKCF